MGCKFSKHSALPFSSSDSLSICAFDLVHYDVLGLSPSCSLTRFSYCISFINDFSRYTWLYLMYSLPEVGNSMLNIMCFV